MFIVVSKCGIVLWFSPFCIDVVSNLPGASPYNIYIYLDNRANTSLRRQHPYWNITVTTTINTQ